ncbi:hypothetical protein FIV06_01305 [Labrenzia sp. THAF191b]|uniref:hypothetical protein n=1 Tax=unclassified Labrenzia TaxID=2648686 RepID=UPI00126925A7|nr:MULTISPECIES: hypothetical protein [unclassified Labrenzia]QFS96035.1 hypothetical protein FIV06_01305 [Labrenzia sp. THAF191b]QFT02350.1 hypothetical protein FIV05_01305 [Labrenzia sp. THAF191a]QFT13892.1 hypothetical protein FIV03_01310 [Labrenzia sp. THAF187b]
MARIFLVFFLLLSVVACQHQQTGGQAYRINRVIVEPGGGPFAPIAAAQLRAKLQAVADDINRQLSPNAPAHDLIVRLESVTYVAPNGPFLLGRSRIKGKMQAGDWRYSFSGSDDGAPGLSESFSLYSFYSPERSFGRIAQRIANKFSINYSGTFRTKRTSWDKLTKATPNRVSQSRTTVPGQPGLVAPPPLVVIGGSR